MDQSFEDVRELNAMDPELEPAPEPEPTLLPGQMLSHQGSASRYQEPEPEPEANALQPELRPFEKSGTRSRSGAATCCFAIGLAVVFVTHLAMGSV